MMQRPNERQKRLPIAIANWAIAYFENHEPIDIAEFAYEVYEMGFQDAERIAEQKENEERQAAFLGSLKLPVPFISPEC